MDLSDCCCCSWESWKNRVYHDLKGAKSLRHRNEMRIHLALTFLTPEEIELAAYDGGGVAVPTGFLPAVQRAVANYQTIYPISRWEKQPGESDKGECGPHSTWTASDPYNDQVQAAIENATGLKGTAAFEEWYGLDSWRCGEMTEDSRCGSTRRARAAALIRAVPSSGDEEFVTAMPVRSQLYAASGGNLAPSDWLKEFLDVFASGAGRSLKAGVRLALTAAQIGVRRASLLKTRMLSDAARKAIVANNQAAEKSPAETSPVRPPRNEEPPSAVVSALLVGGAAALLGGALWMHFRRRRR
jgi:hypothetical protein